MGSPSIKIVLPDGTLKETSAEKVSIKESREAWSDYTLEDGAVVRVRPIIARALRTGEFDAEGNPIYQLTISNVVFVEVPDKLKKRQD